MKYLLLSLLVCLPLATTAPESTPDGEAGYEVEKIKTIGDCYMVVGGVPDRQATHCQQIANFAPEALKSFDEFSKDFVEPLQILVGIHTGTVVAGVVGTQKFSFDL